MCARTTLPILLKLATFVILFITNAHADAIPFSCGNVFLTVSALWRASPDTPNLIDTEIELNWDVVQCNNLTDSPTVVKLLMTDPSEHPNQIPLFQLDLTNKYYYSLGHFRTNVSFGKPLLPGGWNKEENNFTKIQLGPQCFPYWIASYQADRLLKYDCLKIQPTWMWDHRAQLSNVPIALMFLPGTHDSGSYYQLPTLRRRDLLFQKYVLTQDRDIWTQLVHGIRYFDFRIAWYGNDRVTDEEVGTRLWLNHDVIRVTQLLPLLRDIRSFLELSKGEVVVLDIHRFPVGFQTKPSRHYRLVKLLQSEFGHLVASKSHYVNSFGPTLQEMYDSNGRLIIAYNEKSVADQFDWLWPPLPQYWGNKQSVSELRKYIQQVVASPQSIISTEQNPLWAVMAELTPTALEIVLMPYGSLRQMADSVNRNLTIWMRQGWWKTVNVVASDYFLGNNLVDVAISANVRKFMSRNFTVS